MVSQLALETAINMMIVGLLLEAYLRYPRGWNGGPLYQLLCTLITCLGIVLLSANVAEWAVYFMKR